MQSPAAAVDPPNKSIKWVPMPDLLHQISINAAPQAVYAALATQAGLSAWWTADTYAEEKVGSTAKFGFNKRDAVYRMMIKALDPGRQVVWSCEGDNPEWAGTTLTWTIVPDGGGCALRFTHGGWKSASEMFAICNSTWGELMYRLRAFVEGRNPGPHWTE